MVKLIKHSDLLEELRVVDGRNPHEIPKITTIVDYEIVDKFVDKHDSGATIYCLLIDGKFVPASSTAHSFGYDWILSSSYTTHNGFLRWLKRFYPYAVKVSNELSTEGVKNTIKSSAIYCPFDEKKQAFIVPDEFLDDWEI